MIIRKQKILKSAEEVSFMLSFTPTDVRKAIQKLYQLMAKAGREYAITEPMTELDILHFLKHDTFANLPDKYADVLSSWAFHSALRHQFILSGGEETDTQKVYFLSPYLKNKVGRPREVEWDD